MGWLRRLRGTLPGSTLHDSLDEEMRFHLDERTDENIRAGMTPHEARRQALRRFGNVALTKERTRDRDTLRWLDELLRDVRYAARLLVRSPIFAWTAALSLAIGIGANTTIFTVANALLFRAPTGVADPGRLVDIGVSRNQVGFNPSSYLNFLDIRRRTTTLDHVYAHPLFPHAMSLGAAGGAAGAERIFGNAVTAGYFTALGAVPAAGRLFGAGDVPQAPDGSASSTARLEADAPPGANHVVVLSHSFWTRRFNQDPAVVGRTLTLNGQPFTVAGVASQGFHGTGIRAADVWVPLDVDAAMRTNRAGASLMIGGRLKPGVTVAQAAAEIAAIGGALEREFPNENRGKGLRVLKSSSISGASGPVTLLLALLMAIVSLVLAIACANVAGVLLARAAARRREIAVRLAIGAGRARLVRQLLTETALLCGVGGAAGLLLARATTTLLVSQLPSLPFPIEVSLALDGRVILFTAGLSMVAALLSGLVPALQASRADVVPALKDDSHGAPGRSRLRHTFVVAQVAFSILLVVTAGLFGRALQRAGWTDPGFDARGVELASVDLSLAGYTNTTGPLFAGELLERVRRLPRVQSATIARVLPGGFESIRLGELTAPGVTPDGQAPQWWDWNVVEPGYFATLRIPLISGRDFDATDRAGTQPVLILGEAAARYFWPGEQAVGRFLTLKDGGFDGPASIRTRTLQVVGVARDVKSSSLIDGLSSSLIYVPLQQHYAFGPPEMTIAARTTDGRRIAGELRALVASMNPNLPIVTAQTLESYAALGLTPQRIVASVAGSLGLVGLLLAAIGIYGVTAYGVTRRTREFGIRMALGAKRADVVVMVLRQGMWLTGIGCAIGLALGAAVSQLLAGFLFGVAPLDPIAFGAAAALFVAIGLAACYGPARRATRINAIEALRTE